MARMVPATLIYRNAMVSSKGDKLKAAMSLVSTMVSYPDTRGDEMVEALAALLREAIESRRDVQRDSGDKGGEIG